MNTKKLSSLITDLKIQLDMSQPISRYNEIVAIVMALENELVEVEGEVETVEVEVEVEVKTKLVELPLENVVPQTKKRK